MAGCEGWVSGVSLGARLNTRRGNAAPSRAPSGVRAVFAGREGTKLHICLLCLFRSSVGLTSSNS